MQQATSGVLSDTFPGMPAAYAKFSVAPGNFQRFWWLHHSQFMILTVLYENADFLRKRFYPAETSGPISVENSRQLGKELPKPLENDALRSVLQCTGAGTWGEKTKMVILGMKTSLLTLILDDPAPSLQNAAKSRSFLRGRHLCLEMLKSSSYSTLTF